MLSVLLQLDSSAIYWTVALKNFGRKMKHESDPTVQIIEIMVNCPTRDVAETISANLIEQRLVACSNRYAPVQSEYLWQGKIERQEEYPLLLKTRAGLENAVETQVRALHPYDVPPIVQSPVQGANADYIQWVFDVTVQT